MTHRWQMVDGVSLLRFVYLNSVHGMYSCSFELYGTTAWTGAHDYFNLNRFTEVA